MTNKEGQNKFCSITSIKELKSYKALKPISLSHINLILIFIKVAKIRFRLPDGETWQRRFGAKEKLSSVIDFVTSQGYFPDEYKLLSSWPRRDLTSESLDKSLEELKLYPQETLTLEQR